MTSMVKENRQKAAQKTMITSALLYSLVMIFAVVFTICYYQVSKDFAETLRAEPPAEIVQIITDNGLKDALVTDEDGYARLVTLTEEELERCVVGDMLTENSDGTITCENS